jgi:hypothetical protein
MSVMAVLTGAEIAVGLVILFFFLLSIVISLSVKNRDQGNQDLEHFDHEPGDADAR